jgi:hypothetical protein
MSVRLYVDGLRCAIYEEAPGGGDPLDPSSMMNRPVVNPTGWLGNLRFHSDLNYFGVAAKNLNINITHAAIPGVTTQVTMGMIINGQDVNADHLLLQHNLGYVPKFFVIYDNKLIPHGSVVQKESQNRLRYVSAYATTTQIRLHELGASTALSLPSATRNYKVIVFKDPTVSPMLQQLDLYPGEAVFGRGKFVASEPHLRADGAGDVAWPIPTSRTANIQNGGLVVWQPGGPSFADDNYNGPLNAPSYITTSAGV